MADNYLENKMEALRSGKTVLRKNSPSLDTLIHRALKDGASDPSGEMVKFAQIEAALRSASLLGTKFESEISESAQSARISVDGHTSDDFRHLGELLLAIRLKATELGLKTSVEADGSTATIRFHK